MSLLGVLQQSWPVLLLQLFLPQYHLNVGSGVMCLGVLGVDLVIKFEFDMVGGFLGFRGTSECELGRGEIELQGLCRHIGDAYREIYVVFLGISG